MEKLRDKMGGEREGEGGHQEREAGCSLRRPRVCSLPGAAGQLGWKQETGGSTPESGGESRPPAAPQRLRALRGAAPS